MNATPEAVTEATSEVHRIAFQAQPVVKAFIEGVTFIQGFFGPLGCAKTSAGTWRAYFYGQTYPGARIVIIRDTWPNLQETTQYTFFKWFPPGIAGTYHHQRKTFYLHTGGAVPTEILFRALDDERDISNVLSLDVSAAYLDEPQGGPALRGDRLVSEPGIKHDLFRSILARVGRHSAGNVGGAVWMTGNPPSASHWIAKDFGYSGHGDPTNPYPEYRLFLGDQDTNRAHLPPGYYERLERLFGQGTPMARRFLRGEWIEFGTEQPFRSEWITYWGVGDEGAPPEGLTIRVGIDPAIGKSDQASKTAVVVAGQAMTGLNQGRIYVLAAEAGHWSAWEQVDHLLKAVKQWKARLVVIEDVAYQRALGEMLDRESRIRGIPVAVRLVKPEGDKLRRANAWSPFVEDATILFGPGQKELVDAMLAVPMDRHAWDLVDAAGLVVTSFKAAPPPSERLQDDLPTRERAKGYAVRVGVPARRPGAPIPASRLLPRKAQRAKSYAVRG